jgi:hypothetical protein
MEADAPNWFGRNWKWLVPVGCLTLLLLVLGAVLVLVYFVFGMMKQAEPYQHGLAAASANPAVVQALGAPLHGGLMLQGHIEISDEEGSAELTIPIEGPRGEGKVYVVARKRGGHWIYDVLEADIGAPARIDLRSPPVPAPAR